MRHTAVTNDRSDEAPAATKRKSPRHKVRDLMAGHAEAVLELDGHDYRLRITAAGKLILTK
ncbi:MAG: hemin uptake protein HemP [Verrucomicrobiae bacterium]|nr:hemin uptake protein HemP [Verrucomicrobiae bacterium]